MRIVKLTNSDILKNSIDGVSYAFKELNKQINKTVNILNTFNKAIHKLPQPWYYKVFSWFCK